MRSPPLGAVAPGPPLSAWTASSSNAGRAGLRLPSLTGARFLAAALVVGFHVSYEGILDAPVLRDAFAKAGWLGVSFFFVLSGYVMAHSARPGDTARAFWRRRLARIYPAHLVTAAVAFALLAAAGGLPGIGTILGNVLLLQSWSPSPEVWVSGNPVSWSLSCELFFYLAFPLLWRCVSRIRAERLARWAAGTAGAVLAMPLIAQLLPTEPLLVMPDGTTGQWRYWFVYVLPPVRALEFLLGMLLARMVRENRRTGPGTRPALLAVAAGYVLATHVPYLYGLVAATLVPVALLLAALARADAAGRGGWWAAPGLVRLGEASFALYLVHRPVLTEARELLAPDGPLPTWVALFAVAAAVAVSLGLAHCLHAVVENPLARRLGRRSRESRSGHRTFRRIARRE